MVLDAAQARDFLTGAQGLRWNLLDEHGRRVRDPDQAASIRLRKAAGAGFVSAVAPASALAELGDLLPAAGRTWGL